MATEAVTDSNLAATRAFLEAHVETSLFLLGGLRKFGPTAGEHPNSGNYGVVIEDGRIIAVACPTRRGHLLVQTGGREDLADEILGRAAADPPAITGVLGEWRAAASLWARLATQPGWRTTYRARQIVYRRGFDRAVQAGRTTAGLRFAVRALEQEDFGEWDALNNAMLSEEGAGDLATGVDHRRAAFHHRAALGHAWGAFDGRTLASTAVIDEYDGDTAQIGGLFTRAQYRGQGLARATMAAAVADARDRLGFRTVILFTDDDNQPARTLYESMGFEPKGEFGFLFGSSQK